MRTIALIIGVLFTQFVQAQIAPRGVWPQWPQLQAAQRSVGWWVDEKAAVGSTETVPLYIGQDPYPFRSAWAAAILYDQHRCATGGTPCSEIERVAALPLMRGAGDGVSVNWERGGSGLGALRELLHNRGGPRHVECNIDDNIQPRTPPGSRHNELWVSWMQYRETRKWGGYLNRRARSEFLGIARAMGVQDREHLLGVLDGPQYRDQRELLNATLLNPRCGLRTVEVEELTAEVRQVEMGDLAAAQEHIDGALASGRPVMITICLQAHLGRKNCGEWHGTVVIARTWATNVITGDRRKVYRLANTWGEEWQSHHGRGWVFSDQFLAGVTEIVWLRKP